ncbi:hypothetical protein PFISCL1PPCAC_14725, partial [Pristionchus fissidentatus]
FHRFGTICSFQMMCDIVKISLTSVFSLIPDEIAPDIHASYSIATAEVFCFSSCLMHILFAIHRLIFIVFPKKKEIWESSTSITIAICVAIAAFKTFLAPGLDRNLYLIFDRERMSWLFTKTQSTQLYLSIKKCLSYLEIVVVIILDSISFTKLHRMKSVITRDVWDAKQSVEVKLIVQSLLQCLPTLTLIIFYFHVLPTVTDDFSIFLCTLTWNISNGLDGFIIILLHTRKETFFPRKTRIVGTTTTHKSIAMTTT